MTRTTVTVELELDEVLELITAARATIDAQRRLDPYGRHFAAFTATLEDARSKLHEAWLHAPDQYDRQTLADARTVPCPVCDARPGLLCVDNRCRDLPYSHAERVATSIRLDALAGVVLDDLDAEEV